MVKYRIYKKKVAVHWRYNLVTKTRLEGSEDVDTKCPSEVIGNFKRAQLTETDERE